MVQKTTSLPKLNNMSLRKVTIYLLTSCNIEERIAQNIYIHNSNRNYKKLTTTEPEPWHLWKVFCLVVAVLCSVSIFVFQIC